MTAVVHGAVDIAAPQGKLSILQLQDEAIGDCQHVQDFAYESHLLHGAVPVLL
jgi:phage gp45-like